ncbi:MAG: FHA domain-containing protein [Eggerthellaceae bacterium]|jgi:hypothetical protein
MSNTCPVCNGPVSPTDTICPSCGFKLRESTEAFNFINQTGAMGKPVDIPGQKAPVPTDSEHSEKPQMVLTVVRGPQVGVAFVLEDRLLVIGRDPQCDIFLNDMTVSRDHAHIEPVGDAFQITDDDSFNGVWVNNEEVHTALLHDGDFIQIGAFGLQASVN